MLLAGMMCVAGPAMAEMAGPQGYSATMRWYQSAADAGDAQAQFLLAQRYERGVDGDADLARAAEWYRRAAEQGLPEAQFKLGTFYARGAGVGADPALAVEWYGKAAALGLAAAQYNLGVALLNGEGVARDPERALAWVSIAADELAVAVELRDSLLQTLPAEQVAAARQREIELRKPAKP